MTYSVLIEVYFLNSFQITFLKPVGIRVRIGPPHPLVCRKRRLNGDSRGFGLRIDSPHSLVCRKRRLNGGGPEKPRPRVTAGVAR
jgi:hypothetical protein